ncbi:MAG: hypothetical protein HZB80_02295 [Deltaproteobacteria bacterium]|nr:hypothetical protein [Deltaproteobacteria bacterium]
MKNNKLLLVCMVILSIFLISSEALAASKIIKGRGTLTSIEEDGTVIIDKKGYNIDPSVKIIDKKGKKSAIYGIFPPTKVYFEYKYDRNGFVIKRIKEFPDEVHR